MLSFRNAVSIRFKTIALVIGALVMGIGSVLVIGISGFVEDKWAYMVGYDMAQVRSAANTIENQLQKTLLVVRLLNSKVKSSDRDEVRQIFNEKFRTLGWTHLLILRLNQDRTMRVVMGMDDQDRSLNYTLDQLGWDSVRFLNHSVLVGKVPSGEMAVGTLIRDSKEGGNAYLILMKPELSFMKVSDHFQIYLVDSLGDPLFSSEKMSEDKMGKSSLADFLNRIWEGKEGSGVVRWSMDNKNFLVGYQRLVFEEFTVIGMISEKVLLAATSHFLFRSLLLGVGILFITLGLILIFMRRISEALRSMILVTEKVGQGIFSYRVNTKGMANDEVGILATSFNIMIGKIDELMTQVAEGVETKIDQEILSRLQKNHLPSQAFDHPSFQMSGSSLFSEEYGGGWWCHEKFGNYVFLMVGKAEGKGIAAATLTAAAHGAVTALVVSAKMASNPVQLKTFATQLNAAVCDAGKGKQRFPCFLALLDLLTGEIQMVNAGYPIPYLYQAGVENSSEEISDRFQPIHLRKHFALGTSPMMRIETDVIQLKPKDMIFWYTPSLVRNMNQKGEGLSTATILETLVGLFDESGGDAHQISSGMIQKTIRFFNADTDVSNIDEMNIIIATVPPKAYFLEKEKVA